MFCWRCICCSQLHHDWWTIISVSAYTVDSASDTAWEASCTILIPSVFILSFQVRSAPATQRLVSQTTKPYNLAALKFVELEPEIKNSDTLYFGDFSVAVLVFHVPYTFFYWIYTTGAMHLSKFVQITKFTIKQWSCQYLGI